MAEPEGICTCCKGKTTDMPSILFIVAQKISTDWKHLGRKLGLNECEINAIEADNNSTCEKAYQVLNKWFEKNGEAVATKVALCKALHGIGKTSIADIFCDHKRHENYKQQDEQKSGHCNGIIQQQSTTSTDVLQMYVDQLRWLDELVQKIDTEALKTFCERRHKEILEEMISILNERKSQPQSTNSKKQRPLSSFLPRCSSEVHLQPRFYTFSEGQSKDDFPEMQFILCCENCVNRLRFELEKPLTKKESLKDEDSKTKPSSEETKDNNSSDENNNTKL
ncbi:uncharacterized protein LOC114532733 isoform X2 [Dendronephthya gigantea]|uniref:uncharacterized protein LOC114532733 isoform X2 n=1 Tax=Dendronephthya gigantea TaxID=151771 RepID=UPI0010697F59|nr:uncharacterized protein LOC114532733 isoform X2 [Dendronephthya gigantea]